MLHGGLESYDRLFPNQDTMPKGGFGNLIALPLQKRPRENGCSVYVNAELHPYPDQWAFLVSIQAMAAHDIEPTILRATGSVHPLDVTFIDDEDLIAPWRRESPSAKKLAGPTPQSLTVTLANRVYFEKAQLPQSLANRLIRLAAFQNPEFYKAQGLRMSVWDKRQRGYRAMGYRVGTWATRVLGSDRYRKPRLFVATLRYSRASFRCVVWSSGQQVWAELHEQAFRYFGGCPQYVVLDNLKEGVLKPDLYKPELNPVYAATLSHYGVVADPARVRDPNRKGTVEHAIGHTQATALKGRRFESILEQNEYLLHWERTWAAQRIHGTERRQVQAMFKEERAHLKALPLLGMQYFTQAVRTVCDDSCVRVEHCRYLEADTEFARYAIASTPERTRLLKDWVEPDLLVLDDLFLARRISEHAAEVLQAIVHQRYKARRSIVVTSNRVVQDWGKYLSHFFSGDLLRHLFDDGMQNGSEATGLPRHGC